MWYSMFKFGVFFNVFYIFYELIVFSSIFWIKSNLNCKWFKYMKKMSRKFIFILFNRHWGLIYEIKRKFKHVVKETRPRSRARADFKFYKKQTKSENHEIWQDVKISYVEAMVKNWQHFAQVVTYVAHNLEHFWRSFKIVENGAVWFEVKVTVDLWFDSKNFCITNRHQWSYHVKIW